MHVFGLDQNKEIVDCLNQNIYLGLFVNMTKKKAIPLPGSSVKHNLHLFAVQKRYAIFQGD